MILPLRSAALAAALLSAPQIVDAQTTTFIVTSAADDANARDADAGDGTCADANGRCTLRAAIDEANATSGEVVVVLPGRLPGGNTGTYTISRTAPNMASNTLENGNDYGDFDIGGSFAKLTIQGTGTPGPQVTSSPNDRIFDIRSGTVTIERVWITGGKAPAGGNGSGTSPDGENGGDGGGIRVASGTTVNLDQVTITGCVTGDGGNGVVPSSSLDSRTGGDAGDAGDGAGIYVSTGATVTVTRSTIAGNGTGDAGGAGSGLGQDSEPASGGRGGDAGNGGGIYNAGTLTVTSSTITANTLGSPSGGGPGVNGGPTGADGNGGSGGGIATAQLVDGSLTDQGTATLANTIVAGNTAGDLISTGKAPGDDLFDASGGGTFSSNGPNLIGSNESVAAAFATGTLVGTDASPVDANFAGQNSNQTWAVPVIVLNAGSPAIDAGSSSATADYDGRGFLRDGSQGTGVDLGAYEANSTDAPISVRLNEIDVNTSTGDAEFVEIKNTGDYAVQADDLALVAFDANGGNPGVACFAANLYGEIAPGAVFTVGDADVTPKDQPLDLDVVTSGGCGASANDQFVDGSGAVALYTGTAGNYTSVTAGSSTSTRQDVIVYDNAQSPPGAPDDKRGKTGKIAMDLCGAFGLASGCAASDSGDGQSIQRDGSGNLTSGTPNPGTDGAPVPVTWVGVGAFAKTVNTATVTWRTASEVDNAGFAVERLDGDAWVEAATEESLGPDGGSYAVDVAGLNSGEHVFRIRQDDYDGLRSYSGAVAVTLVGGGRPRLYPNPAYESVTLEAGSTSDGPTDIEIVDALGRRVAVYRFARGTARPTIPVTELPSGRYLVRVSTAGQTETLRLQRQ